MKNLSKYLSFGALAALVVWMMAATVLEKVCGTAVAFSTTYHHPFFIVLWGVAAASGLVYLVRRGVPRKFWTFTLHLAFVLILAGALTTFITGEKGRLYLTAGETASAFEREDGKSSKLPFTLKLDRFSVSYYPGTKAAEDYMSEVTVLPEGIQRSISLNHILKYRGYRFYQADFDDGGTVLAVAHDPWGIGITYAGYLLLLVSMLGFFFQKGTAFRAALKRIAGVALLLLLLTPAIEAKEKPEVRVLPEEVADAFGDLFVYYNDRICPLSTLAHDYCLKAYGKSSWNGYSSEQVVTGWLFYYDWWKAVPFKLNAKDRGGARESEMDWLQRSVASGQAFAIYPLTGSDGTIGWYSCEDSLPPQIFDDYDLWTFVRKSLDVIAASIRAEDWNEALRIIQGIKAYQEKTAGSVLPTERKIRLERTYNAISRPMVPFMASITLGLILFIISGILMAGGRQLPRSLRLTAVAVLALIWIYLTIVLALRWSVSGHAPFSGSYCVMLLMAWLSCLSALLAQRLFPLALPLGLLLAGFTMLVASLQSANPQITRLMPVLSSPLLSIHVLSMMLSYTLLGVVTLNGIMGLCLPKGGPSERMMDISLVVLYPAVFLLAFGTFLGAIWANISWGSYWAWDPKETWALITLLVYSFALHGTSINVFRKPRFFHAFCVLAFLCVLVTYFGVNLVLGGMHAYA